jgi:hypothetical protein
MNDLLKKCVRFFLVGRVLHHYEAYLHQIINQTNL